MRGDGRIYSRKGTDILWCAYYVRGKKIRESTGETDQKRAERYLKNRVAEKLMDVRGVRRFVAPKSEKASVGDLLDALQADYEVRGKLESAATKSRFKIANEQFGHLSATAFTTDDAREYIKVCREQKYRDGTINKHLQLVSQAFTMAVREGKLTGRPFIPKLSEADTAREGFFEREQFRLVVEHLPEYLKDVARLAYKCGWRSGAVLPLEWAHVRDEEILLIAANSKNRKPVTIPIDDELTDILERRRAASVYEAQDGTTAISRYVFHRRGEKMHSFRKAWIAACCAAGVGKMVCQKCESGEFEMSERPKPKHGPRGARIECVRCHAQYDSRDRLKYIGKLFHDFRRTAARNMVKGGVPVQVAMQITGHRTPSMFQRYAIVDQEQKLEAFEKAKQFTEAAPRRKVVRFGK